jgi:pyruvate kinase
MLSGESAVGAFPEEAVLMLGRIAVSAERHREALAREVDPAGIRIHPTHGLNARSRLLEQAVELTECDAVIVPTKSGHTARAVSRGRPSVWIIALSSDPATLRGLCFSRGVHPMELDDEREDWNDYARALITSLGFAGKKILLVAGPSKKNPKANQRIEVIEL